MAVLATLILLIACCVLKRCDNRTKKTLLKMLNMTLRKPDNGFIRVEMLNMMGDRSAGFSKLERHKSVNMYWFTKCGIVSCGLLGDRWKSTPASIPSPSNQCASRPRSSFVTGFAPFLTYSPPKSSRGMVPVYVHGVGACVFDTGAKFPVR